ncbi:MAG: hypothetical protein ACLPKE_24115 [Streptosporangiaceae bacterium]
MSPGNQPPIVMLQVLRDRIGSSIVDVRREIVQPNPPKSLVPYLHVQVNGKSLDIQFDPAINMFVWYDDGSGNSRGPQRTQPGEPERQGLQNAIASIKRWALRTGLR